MKIYENHEEFVKIHGRSTKMEPFGARNGLGRGEERLEIDRF